MTDLTSTAMTLRATVAAIRVAPGQWPLFPADEFAANTRVLESGRVNYWTSDEGRAFEEEFAAYGDCRQAIAISNRVMPR